MDVFVEVKQILIELLDVESEEITPETYLVRDLGAESIDFLELAVAVNAGFGIDVNDDVLFLKKLRACIIEAREKNQASEAALADRYPFLPIRRREEILGDLEAGPVLKVMDIVCYVEWQSGCLATTG